MARVNGGFFGELSGSVGNVTFARSRGGIQTARRRAAPSNPRTAAQQSQRGRFKQIQAFASAFLDTGLIRAFWQPYATGGLSAYNAFMKANSAAMPDGFDPAAGLVSRGNGFPAVVLTDVAPSGADPNTYVLSIDGGSGAANDLLVGLLYNALQNQAVMVDAGATRGDGQVEVPVPAAWVQDDEDALFAYAFAYRIRGRNELRLSDTSRKKVNGNPFQAPAPDVPPTEAGQEVPFGQAAG